MPHLLEDMVLSKFYKLMILRFYCNGIYFFVTFQNDPSSTPNY